MKPILRAFTAVALLGSSSAFAQNQASSQPVEATETPAPSTTAPQAMPPTPPGNPGLPPGETAGQAPAPITPQTTNGQWTYTSQYGWVYLPYNQSYTHVSPDGSLAYQYAYYPAQGWVWLESPWVLGWGPRPYWGYYGYNHFAWYAHPWFHVGVAYGGHFGYRTGFGHIHGAAAYGRHGGGYAHPAHGHGHR